MPPLQQLILSHRCTKVVLATTGLLAVACTASLLLTDRVHSKTPDSYHFERAFPRFSIDSSATQLDTSKQSIPKVLHHVYLAGLDSLRREEELAGPQPGHAFPGYNSTVRHSCPQVHKDWQYMFWNHSQAEDLIQTSYPWFLDTFRSYSTIVQKGHSQCQLIAFCLTACVCLKGNSQLLKCR